MAATGFQAVVVGQESLHNLRLADLFRKRLGRENVFRYLELRHLLEFLAEAGDRAIAVFLDLFSFDLTEVTDTIGYVRGEYPQVVFSLYLSDTEFKSRWAELPPDWQKRLLHYYRIFKQPEDTELEPVARHTLSAIQMEAGMNVSGEIIRMTEPAGKSPLPPHLQKPNKLDSAIFISYSRQDWDSFVSPLVERLRHQGYTVWVDQHLLVGGDDWMDAIGAALDQCQVLLLVMSPEAVASKFVKMEYRYFFNHDKKMIPLLYRPVERVPPELSVTQYINFSQGNDETAFAQLVKVLDASLKP